MFFPSSFSGTLRLCQLCSSPDENHPGRAARAGVLWKMFVLSYLALLAICSASFYDVFYLGGMAVVFSTAVCLTYCVLYLLPVLLPLLLFNHMASRISFQRLLHRCRLGPSWMIYLSAILGFSLVLMFLLADTVIFRMFNFHINGFVWNLLFTRGGIQSMGGDTSAYVALGFVFVGLLGLEAVFWWVSLNHRFLHRWLERIFSRRRIIGLLVALLLLAGIERVAYGLANIYSYRPVLLASRAFLFYVPCTFDLPVWLSPPRDRRIALPSPHVRIHSLRYPLKPIESVGDPPRHNIVFLVAESLRADAVDSEIMPATHQFARESVWYRNHYSGGNGTRMGMFALFYGLYSNYWFAFLNATHPPVLTLLLKERNYQFGLYTSAQFTYPEFDKTLWAGLEPAEMREGDPDLEGWENDQAQVTRLLNFIDRRDTSRPFMTFLFFESPHARYYFPPESTLRKDYLEDFNYVTTSLKKNMHRIKNRYDNSCHHLDSQLRRILDHLKDRGLMDSTIVVITGDHGEEFMEKGNWGHNSEFTEEQLRTPLLLWVPGHAPREVSGLSSHLDVAPTLMTLLGVKNPPEDYSLGMDLFAATPRTWTVVGDWGDMAFIDAEYKVKFFFESFGFSVPEVTTVNDQEVVNGGEILVARNTQFAEIMKGMGRFSR
jgi:hypothetical protein